MTPQGSSRLSTLLICRFDLDKWWRVHPHAWRFRLRRRFRAFDSPCSDVGLTTDRRVRSPIVVAGIQERTDHVF